MIATKSELNGYGGAGLDSIHYGFIFNRGKKPGEREQGCHTKVFKVNGDFRKSRRVGGDINPEQRELRLDGEIGESQ